MEMEFDDLHPEIKETLQRAQDVDTALRELGSNLSFTVVTRDGTRFESPVEIKQVKSSAVVWWVRQPATLRDSFRHLISCQTSEEELAWSSTDREADRAAWELAKLLKDSDLPLTDERQLETVEELARAVQPLVEKSSAGKTIICILVSYQVTVHDTITLFAHHPAVPLELAIKVYQRVIGD